MDIGRALDQADSDFAAGRLGRGHRRRRAPRVTGTPTFSVRRGDGPERLLDADPLAPVSVAAALERELGR